MIEMLYNIASIMNAFKIDLSTFLTLIVGVVIVIIQVISNSKIATKLETVKKQHTNEIESLKSQLDINAQRKKQVFEDAKQALYELNTLVNEWILFIGQIDYERAFNERSIKNIKSESNTLMRKIFRQRNLLSLILNDEQIRNSCIGLYDSVHSSQKAISKHCNTAIGYEFELLAYSGHYVNVPEFYVDLAEAEPEPQLKHSELVNVIIPKIWGDMNDEDKKLKEKLYSIYKSFIIEARSYLNQS